MLEAKEKPKRRRAAGSPTGPRDPRAPTREELSAAVEEITTIMRAIQKAEAQLWDVRTRCGLAALPEADSGRVRRLIDRPRGAQ